MQRDGGVWVGDLTLVLLDYLLFFQAHPPKIPPAKHCSERILESVHG